MSIMRRVLLLVLLYAVAFTIAKAQYIHPVMCIVKLCTATPN